MHNTINRIIYIYIYQIMYYDGMRDELIQCVTRSGGVAIFIIPCSASIELGSLTC